jgi:DNA repair protein RecO (recombination protein O)
MPSRERSQRVEAVVLRHIDWGEADRLLWLYTRELGKVRSLAKGARKPRSRKAGHLEPFTRVSLQLAKGREMLLITQAETVAAYLTLREELLLVGYASYVVELLDRFTYEEGQNISLYRLLIDTLDRLDRKDDPLVTLRYYEIRLLDLLGFRPQLFHCARCGVEIRPESQYLSAQEGGVICPQCGAEPQGARPISMDALRYLRHFQRSSYTEACRAQLTPMVNAEIERMMQYYLTYLLERGLNSPEFLRRVRHDLLNNGIVED